MLTDELQSVTSVLVANDRNELSAVVDVLGCHQHIDFENYKNYIGYDLKYETLRKITKIDVE